VAARRWKARAGAIAQTLEELRPDLVCLQEVWREGTHNQAAELAERLSMVHVFAPDRAEGGVDQGVALLSRWSLTETAHRTLPVPSEVKEPNVALRATVQGPR
jgi:endonuclease/exonuclease/phosphatase family metal-dependent hydrolase